MIEGEMASPAQTGGENQGGLSSFASLDPEVSEEVFRWVSDSVPVMIWMAGPNGEPIWYNKQWLDFTGRTLEEERGNCCPAEVHPEDIEHCNNIYWSSFKERKHFETEYRLRRNDGKYRWLLDHGVPRYRSKEEFMGFIGACVDITERMNAEKALQASEEHLRMLVESATEFAIFSVSESGIIESWSEGAERVFGYADEEIIGRSVEILFTPEDRAAGVAFRELAVARATGKSYDDRWHVRKDGSVIYAAGAVSPIRGSSPLKYVKIARDLSERKRMEDALKEADLRKNEFIATLAHELRNPLAPIRTGLEILRNPDANETTKQSVLGIMERQMDQMVYLVNDLLEVARIAQGKIQLKLQPVDIIRSIHLAMASCQAEAEAKRHKFTFKGPDESIHVLGDEVRLEQVFMNLFNNAIKYTHDGGTIEVKASIEGQQAVIKVIDNGIGIPPDKLTEIFGMFNQATPHGQTSSSGLGIGLSVVKAMVEMHGGTIRAASDGTDNGSEFTVVLPLLLRETSVPTPEPEGQDPPDGEITAARRILLVDDNLDAAATLKAALMSRGYKVHIACTGAAAVAEAEDFQPEVCVCDIGLPDMSGYEVARLLSLAHPDILLISISGWGQEADRDRSKDAGFQQHLVKPIRLEQLWPLLEQEITP
jgi:PAS domain S-box-containing protein